MEIDGDVISNVSLAVNSCRKCNVMSLVWNIPFSMVVC